MQFKNQDLSGSVFQNVKMASCHLNDCNLSGATFEDINLGGSKLSNVNLSGVEITDCNLQGMKINGIFVAEAIEALKKVRDMANKDMATREV